MAIRILILFLPSLFGLFWRDDAGIFIVWSLAGSFLIAATAQTQWFRQSDEDLAITHRLLRPICTYHFYFIALNVVGGAFYAANIAGYTLSGRVFEPSQYDLTVNAVAQGLMLLAHASVTAGMKLAGFRYGPPKYVVRFLPPYGFIVLSLICLALGAALASIPSLWNLSQKILQVASTAVLLEIAFAIRRRNFANTVVGFLLLVLNLVYQTLTGWKGLTLGTMITLGALLYPLMPRRTVLGGIGFVLLWMLYLHPFGMTLRPLAWYEGVDKDTAVAISIDQTLNMTLEQRLDNVWTMMVVRANELYQFRKYLEYVPDVHPYFGFDLVKEAALAFVPRIVWPQKPNLEIMAMQRVYAAGIVSEQATVSEKSNFYQDAYLSGGWLVIVPASLALGFLSMLISQACERYFGGYEIGTCLIFTSLFGTAVNTAPTFAFFVGTIWTSLLTMFAIFFVGRLTDWIIQVSNSPQMSVAWTTHRPMIGLSQLDRNH